MELWKVSFDDHGDILCVIARIHTSYFFLRNIGFESFYERSFEAEVCC